MPVGWVFFIWLPGENRLHSSFQTFNTRAVWCLKSHERKSSWRFPITERLHTCSKQLLCHSWWRLACGFLQYFMHPGLSPQPIFHSLWPTQAYLRQNTGNMWPEGASILRPTEAATQVEASETLCPTRQARIGKSPSWAARRGPLFWWLWATHSDSKGSPFPQS